MWSSRLEEELALICISGSVKDMSKRVGLVQQALAVLLVHSFGDVVLPRNMTWEGSYNPSSVRVFSLHAEK